ARPVAGGRVERDVHALEAVPLELFLQQPPQRFVEVREHRVQRDVDDQHGSDPNHMAAHGVKNAGPMTATIYDEVRYSNFPYAQTHPARLATVAILHGLEPPDPFHARVLEIGCGAGANLLAMAAGAPGIRALGIDLAAAPIAEATAAVAEVGL